MIRRDTVEIGGEPREHLRHLFGASRRTSPPPPTSSGWPPLSRYAAGSPHASASSNALEQDRPCSRRGRRRARAEAERHRCESTGAACRIRSNRCCDCPTKVTSNRSESRFRSSQASTSAPFRGFCDQLDAITRSGLPSSGSRSSGGWKIDGSTVFEITTGSRSSMPELGVLLEAVARLEHGRVRELGVDRGDPCIGSVVESAIRADRTVDSVHHPAVRAREPAQTARSRS